MPRATLEMRSYIGTRYGTAEIICDSVERSGRKTIIKLRLVDGTKGQTWEDAEHLLEDALLRTVGNGKLEREGNELSLSILHAGNNPFGYVFQVAQRFLGYLQIVIQEDQERRLELKESREQRTEPAKVVVTSKSGRAPLDPYVNRRALLRRG